MNRLGLESQLGLALGLNQVNRISSTTCASQALGLESQTTPESQSPTTPFRGVGLKLGLA